MMLNVLKAAFILVVFGLVGYTIYDGIKEEKGLVTNYPEIERQFHPIEAAINDWVNGGEEEYASKNPLVFDGEWEGAKPLQLNLRYINGEDVLDTTYPMVLTKDEADKFCFWFEEGFMETSFETYGVAVECKWSVHQN